MTMEPETIETATGEVKAALEATKARLGFVPNMYGYMGKLPGVLMAYMSTYEGFRKTAGFVPAEQEVVFLTISRTNGCPYCMAAHSMIADKMSGVAPDVLKALRANQVLPDARLQSLSIFTQLMVETRGNPKKQEVDAFLAAGYAEQQVLGIVLAISCKTFSNYVNHLAHTPIDPAFTPYIMD
jgi:uncharacterized peroxidase-related enzyme